jgi:hypothetical protein
MKKANAQNIGISGELTFGVEIETYVKDDSGLRIGNYHGSPVQVPYLPAGWTAQNDASIRAPRGYTACEIVSPILRGKAGIEQVKQVVETLRVHGHRVNESCGVHVHVGWVMLDANGNQLHDRNGDKVLYGADRLATLITIASYLEAGLYSITGSRKREAGTYCKSVKKAGSATKAEQIGRSDRYNLLNTTNLYGNKKTVEFRCFSGSVDATKIVGWIMVCLGIVEKALTCKRMPSWNGKDISASRTTNTAESGKLRQGIVPTAGRQG